MNSSINSISALCGYQWKLEVSKVFKSKCPVFAQFWSKYDNSSADWWKTGQNLKEKYSYQIFVKNKAVIGKKPVAGVGETSNSGHRQINLCSKKNSKITFFSGPSNIVKMGSEISKYFSWFFQSAKYLMLFWGWCSTRPHYFIHILPPDRLNCNWLFVNLAAAPDCVQLVPKYFSKVKLCSWQSPNISVWNNYTAIKWVRWWGSGLNL